MENREAIASLKTLCNTCTMFPKCVNNKPECFQAIEKAISALEFKERYDQFWEEVKTAGKSGKETELHHSGRAFRIREVAQ